MCLFNAHLLLHCYEAKAYRCHNKEKLTFTTKMVSHGINDYGVIEGHGSMAVTCYKV